jgi:hypothetical protein
MPGWILTQSLKNWNLECRKLTDVQFAITNYTICWVDEDVVEPSLATSEPTGNETSPPEVGPKSATYLTTTAFVITLILSAML